MTVEIQLTRGYVATVDNVDADLAAFKWRAEVHISKTGSKIVYAARSVRINGSKKTLYIHKIVMERMLGCDLTPGLVVDHINNENSLDNRRDNLRPATIGQNVANCKQTATESSPYKGICFTSSKRSPWLVQIRENKNVHYLGRFSNPIEAHRIYCIASLKYHGEFANFGTNSPFKGMTLEQLQAAQS